VEYSLTESALFPFQAEPTQDKIPFSVYDFLAYLSSGTVWLVTLDYVLGMGLLEREKTGDGVT
jgi:hypothetical protein